ncbi:MAG: DUF4314 domain-containing protein [Mageeibacillus sp.]|nr:DUF4314 domain-containing protein [Mageeibacillus sp.]
MELVQRDDLAAPPVGTKGTVTGVDDIGDMSNRRRAIHNIPYSVISRNYSFNCITSFN